MVHVIKSVTPLDGLTLLVCFSNGETRRYDMAALAGKNELFRDLIEIPGLFRQVRTDVGGEGISWNDEIDLSAEELWTHGVPCKAPFDGLIAFSDASALWGLSESALRKAAAYGKLVQGVDIQKFGKQWVVTREAMEREYGRLA